MIVAFHTKRHRAAHDAVAVCKQAVHTIWKLWSGYHHHSLVETKMHCFKRQVVKLNIRVALLNRFTQLG